MPEYIRGTSVQVVLCVLMLSTAAVHCSALSYAVWYNTLPTCDFKAAAALLLLLWHAEKKLGSKIKKNILVRNSSDRRVTM